MTAVEWFNQQLVDKQIGKGDARSWDIIFQQAKEMEKKKAHEYAEFAIRCDRLDMRILNFEDWIKL
jgi:hypothetical protein